MAPYQLSRKQSGFLNLWQRSKRVFVKPHENVKGLDSPHHLSRIGGVSVFDLDAKYAIAPLVIPARFASLMDFLLLHGRCEPGIFRINGQLKTIAALKEYFLRQMHPYLSEGDEADIEVTIRLATLPNSVTLPYNIHDIAGTFKLFLDELRGGILGSVEVFESLRKALVPIKDKEDELDFQCRGLEDEFTKSNAKWVAKVLCTVGCSQRRNLILAIFGLLAFLKQDQIGLERCDSLLPPQFAYSLSLAIQNHCSQSQVKSEQMSSRALGVVFAPLLLGNLSDQIRINHHTPRPETSHGLRRRSNLSNSPKKQTKPKPTKPTNINIMHLKHHSYPTNILPVTILEPLILQQQQQQQQRASLEQKRMKSSSRKNISGKKMQRIEDCVELNESVERNRVACRMVELLVGNWEGIVQAMRDVGYSRIDGTRLVDDRCAGRGKVHWG
ncbi:hypothetical protein EJ08DRAFT_654300 [Tothia fuscella]|uniref:Rho-GAP domain-containing protein n=1 Tax=Tothia fuscella TaxID=1048955 RepID=A0A9P4TT34_9PEZI|nr:hypothetical protein EJ08DRAFT_654300 [Tothia fuscella]